MRAQVAALFLLVSTSFAELKLDPTFNPNLVINGREGNFYRGLESMALQADGKIIIGGVFSNVSGALRHSLARLNANGTVDVDFNPPTTELDVVYDIVIQSDGKILYTGTVPGLTDLGPVRGTAVRLNTDGRRDPDFHVPDAPGVTQIIFAPDAKIYIAGLFRKVDGVPRCYLARLHANGQLDETFSTPVVPHPSTEGGQVRIALQADGKIIMAGMFYTTNGGGIFTRFNQDGSEDMEFQPSGVYFCSDLEVLPNGQILHGSSSQFGNDYIALRMFNQRGEQIPTFRDDNNFRGFLRAMWVQPDGKIMFGGQFLYTASGRHLARVYANGSIDPSLDIGSGFTLDAGSTDYQYAVNAIVAQPDGKLLIGGQFHRYNGEPRSNLVRLMGETAFATKVELPGTSSVLLTWKTVAVPGFWKVESTGDFRSWNVIKENVPAGVVEVEEALSGSAKFYRVVPQE